MPEGTIDPTPYLLEPAFYTMTGLMCVAALSHMMLKPVNEKYYELPDNT